MRRKNPWAICTSSVGRKDKNKYERCVKSVKNEAIDEARHALAEACWKGYKARGMKKKGNRMVPNCVKEGTLDDLPTQMKNAARKAKAKGEDQVDAVEKVRKDFEAKADDKHYGKKEESDDP